MKNLFLTTLSLTSILSMATIDSYTSVKYPVNAINEVGICLVDSLAVDGITNIGTGEAMAARALTKPFMIPAIQSGEDEKTGLLQVNPLFESDLEISMLVDVDNFKKSSITIDASVATSKAKSLEQRKQVIENVKIALVASLANMLTMTGRTATVKLIKLPSQEGVTNPIPSEFKFPFYSQSPYLLALKKELNVMVGIKKCQ
jgi:hypothetical protein